jgi:NAD(P) transhydrogenase
VGVEEHPEGTVTVLESGKRIAADVVLYSAGRRAATSELDLEKAGIAVDDRGLIPVGPRFRTAVEHIFAVGDVIGFPSLAASSAEQGRVAALEACGRACEGIGDLLPFGVYAVPEISFVGRTEEELTHASVPFEVGRARYRQLARGQILGDARGMLKLIVSTADRSILGVHAIGTGATELIHIGQATMALGGSVDYLVDAVFNYPTLAEAYKVAARDAVDRLARLGDVAST